MRPEITHYLIKITVELADILGITLDEGKYGFAVDHFSQLASLSVSIWSASCCSCLETGTYPIFIIFSICLKFPVNHLTF